MPSPDYNALQLACFLLSKFGTNKLTNHARWVNDIEEEMRHNGFGRVTVDRIFRPSILSQINELHLLSITDVRPGLSKAINAYREKYMNQLIHEYGNGVSTMDGCICVIGKKPHC